MAVLVMIAMIVIDLSIILFMSYKVGEFIINPDVKKRSDYFAFTGIGLIILSMLSIIIFYIIELINK